VRNEGRLVAFNELAEPLTRVIRQYGPPRKSVHPEYPFWWLQTDGLWEIPTVEPLARSVGHSQPKKSELLRVGSQGGFPEAVWKEFKSDPELVGRTARLLLDAHFPPSLHEEILNSAGLSLVGEFRPSRDGQFPLVVLSAYGHRCAVCRYDVKLGTAEVALEAAHIKWHQAGGPDRPENGLALCAIHHKAFDRGAIGISDALTILVSCHLHGEKVQDWFQAFNGRTLLMPTRKEWIPNAQYVKWHYREVFRGPAQDQVT
jgi:putative restriction endonuclease